MLTREDIEALLPYYDNMTNDEKKALLISIKEFEKLESSTNEVYLPLYDNKSRYLVLMGGGGSGKSIFAGQKILRRIVTEQGHRILVVRKVARTLRESCFQQLRGQISSLYEYSEFEINKTDMKITHKNGNEILFAGLDDVEKLKSIYNISSIWIEEASELDPEDFRQLDIRLRGETKSYKQIIFSFNPININHWLKKEFFDSKKPESITLHTTYKDNKFLDIEAIKVLEAFKETDPYYYDVYCCGNWGVIGKTIFDSRKINDRIQFLRRNQTFKTGYFTYQLDYAEKIIDSSIAFIEASEGYIKIYEEPKKGYPYVIGGDTSGEGSDNFTAQVIDNSNGNQIATLKHKFDEDMYAKQMYCLGQYYNRALISVEMNYSTYPIKELERLGYHYQYIREQIDSYTGATKKAYGFRTDKMTRPLIIANLVQIVREHTDLFNDIDTLEEMLTFVRNENGRPEAQSSSHDDLIMALCIAYYCRSRGNMSIEHKKPKLPDDMPDDVRADLEASPEMMQLYLQQNGLI